MQLRRGLHWRRFRRVESESQKMKDNCSSAIQKDVVSQSRNEWGFLLIVSRLSPVKTQDNSLPDAPPLADQDASGPPVHYWMLFHLA